MTLKEMLDQVLQQSGFLVKGAFFGSVDPDDKQMTAIANRAATEMANYYLWSKLHTSYTVTVVSGTTRYSLPADFKSLVPDSAWEVEGNSKVEFPVPLGRWFMYKFSTWSDGGTMRVRLYGDEIEVHDPEEGADFNFEYISKYPVRSVDGVRKEYFTADDDTWLLDDQTLILGIQAHWQQAKLMPSYMEHFQNYHQNLAQAIGRDNGGRTIGGIGSNKFGRGAPYYPLYRRG